MNLFLAVIGSIAMILIATLVVCTVRAGSGSHLLEFEGEDRLGNLLTSSRRHERNKKVNQYE